MRSRAKSADSCTCCTPRFWRQWWALMVKNWHVKRRNWITSLMEVIIPVFVMLILVSIRSAVPREDKDPTHYFFPSTPNSAIDPEALILNGGGNSTATSYASTEDPLRIVSVSSMEEMAIKIARRGHIVTISPMEPPFFGKTDPNSFSSFLENFINQTIQAYGITDSQRQEYTRGFSSLKDMDNFVRKGSYPSEGYVEAGIGFSGTNVDNTGFSYTIRMNQTGGGSFTSGFQRQIPNTIINQDTDDLSLALDTENVREMYFSGFLALQDFIGAWAISRARGGASAQKGSTFLTEKQLIPFPTPDHTVDDFAAFTVTVLPLLFTLGFLWPVTRMIKAFVEEKEQRIKEGMKIVGLFGSSHFFSWFTCYAIVALVYSILIVVVSGSVFQFSSPAIVFFFFYIYGLVIIAFCWLISSIFSKASVGSTLGALIFLASFFGFFGIPPNTAKRSDKLAACLSAPICFGFGAQTLIEFESVNQGVTSANFSTQTSNFSMADAIGFLIIDFFLYLVLALYFERVIPQQWGTQLPPWFLCLPSWWWSNAKPILSKGREFGEFYEVKGGPEEIGVALQNLHKRFPNQAEEEAAVKDVNIDMYVGQIFALLGHNGAGKTTTINMLTGMLEPTSGDALIFGRSIRTSMRHIRADLGMCPQHNILWDYLTVEEHLYVYGRLKGIPYRELDDITTQLTTEVGLTEKRRVLSKNLSGGMKRKLSVMMALVGEARVVFLDEPTSGMDPFSRRSTWEMLKKSKSGRVVILTTHFMDEADQLGDRIGIMHQGHVVACGTSLFLKNRYGVGYSLVMTKQEQTDVKELRSCVEEHVEGANILSEVAGEIVYQLPKAQSSNFADLFDDLDKNMKTFGIGAYSISVTTLEEVFLKVGENFSQSKRHMSVNKDVEMEELNIEGKSKLRIREQSLAAEFDYKDIKIQQQDVSSLRLLSALLKKRWHTAKRSYSVWLWQLVYPTLLIVAGIGLLKLGVDNFRRDVPLNMSIFNTPNRVPIGNLTYPELFRINDRSNPILVNGTTPQGDAPLTATGDCDFGLDDLADSAEDMSKYLLCTWDSFKESRYGAYVEFVEVDNSTGRVKTIFHNTTATYGSAIFLNLLNEAELRQQTENSNANLDATLSAWPRTRQQEALSTTFVALIAAIGYAFMPASVARQIVEERTLKSKHLQIISGVPLPLYWAANYIWDISNMLPSALLSIAWFSAYDLEDLEGEAAGVLFVAVILYCLSIVAFTYCVSFFFNDPGVAQNVCLLCYVLLGAILLVASIVLDLIPDTTDINADLKFMYRLFPSYCLGEIIINLLTRSSIFLWGSERGVWDLEISGYPLIFMAWESVAYLVVLFVVEYILSSPALYSWCFERASQNVEDQNEEEEDDVLKEKKRIKQGAKLSQQHDEDAIVLKGLRKIYGEKTAVKDMWFGVSKGQCFGFLGINGAGKTTTLKMLTGDVIPTRGTAQLAGHDILENQREVRKRMGYCPQFDALMPKMTARETLRMYAIFKGVNDEELDGYVDKILTRLTLTPYADKASEGYSGGNKRKLSVGIALIGGPPIIFMDEPSTGMDPVSRRFMWNLISNLSNTSIILTTHSMEECEALCSRIGIMVSGRLQCIGPIPTLKKKYASGYQVDVKVNQDCVQMYKKWVHSTFGDAKLLEDQGTNMKHQVAQDKKSSLGSIFRKIEESRKEIGIVEYSVSETTLEQIFIGFARHQKEEKGAVAGFHHMNNDGTDVKRSQEFVTI